MTQEAGYTIGQLAEAGGVTTRAIRFYTAEGLLPPPDTRGRFARYSDVHLQRLRLIARLKQDYLPLGVIRERLECLTDSQIAALSEGEGVGCRVSGVERGKADGEIAAGDWPPGQETRKPGKELFQYPTPDAMHPTPDTLPPELFVASPGRKRVVLLVSPMLAPSSHLPAELSEEEPPLFEASDTWQRITLAPGVELHIRLPDSPQTFDALSRLIQETKALFKSLR